MRYVIDDTPIIEAEVMTLPKPEVSHEVLLPIIDRQIDPNIIIVPKPTLISKTSSSIEVEQTFQCDVDYYGGVGIEQGGAVDAKLVKNPNIMTATLTGLTMDTEYTIKGVGLPILGNETIGEGLVVRTNASPIPDEYQLVEFLESTGDSWMDLRMENGEWGVDIEFTMISNNSGCGRLDNNAPLISFENQFFVAYKEGIGVENWGYLVGPYDKHHVLLNYLADKKCIDNGSLINTVTQIIKNVGFIGLFGSVYGGSHWKTGKMKIFHCFYSCDEVESYKLYPVYRKSDNKPGMYDIVNNAFYINQGTGEFIVGPNKEWEE